MNAHAPMARFSKARLKRLIVIGNVLAFAVGLWTLLFATMFYWLSLALCFLIPLAAIALEYGSQGTLDFEAHRGRRSPLSLATLLIVPAIGLGGRAINDLNFTSYALLIAETACAAIGIVVLFLRLEPDLKRDVNQLGTIVLFVLAYSYGVVAFADVLLDPASGRDVETVIRDKHVHVSGNVKGSSVWRKIAVDPAAVPGGGPWIEVRPDLFASFARGEQACVHQSPGLLGTPWYDLRRCPR